MLFNLKNAFTGLISYIKNGEQQPCCSPHEGYLIKRLVNYLKLFG